MLPAEPLRPFATTARSDAPYSVCNREKALHLLTNGSAWFSREHELKSAIAVGEYADLAVLYADYFSVPDEDIKAITFRSLLGGLWDAADLSSSTCIATDYFLNAANMLEFGMKLVLGFLLALGIGVVCRITGIPVPAPPVILGALLVVAMTCGYLIVDYLAAHRPSNNKPLCGGPTGSTKSSKSTGDKP